MNARSMTSKLKRFGESWQLPSSSSPIYGVLGQDSSKIDLPLGTPIETGAILRRAVDGSMYLCQSTCTRGGMYLSVEVSRCSHLATVYRHLPASKDTFGRETAIGLQPVLENIPLHLVNRTPAPDAAHDRHKIKWSCTFETSTVYDIRPLDGLSTATSEFRVLGAVELTPGVLTISAITV